MKRLSFFTFLFSAFLLSLFAPLQGFAQQYSFSVPELKMQAFVQLDSKLRIIYDITFENSYDGRTIDVVDLGMPHGKYSFTNMKAVLRKDNQEWALSDIRRSEYVKPGVEVHLGAHSISRGQRAELHFEFTMPDLIYQDTTDKTYASLRITPTWFDPQFVRGNTKLNVALFAPPGVKPEELKYQDIPFSDKALYVGLAAGIWQTTRPITSSYLVGMSFPKRGLTKVIELSAFDLLIKWFKERPEVQAGYSLLLLALFSFLFFRFTGGTGCTVFVLLLGVFALVCVNYPGFHLLAILPLLLLICLSERSLKKKKRSGYLPAIAEVEGGGIKRGLTAPEAAILLEMPFSKVVTLTIFGMIKKGVLEMTSPSPLAVQMNKELLTPLSPETKAEAKKLLQALRKQVGALGGVFHGYEGPFLLTILENPNKALNEVDFSSALEALINDVVKKMKNFDLSDTKDYYRRQISKAIEAIKGIEEIKIREQQIDDKLEWLLLGDDFSDAVPDTYRPRWHRRHSSSDGMFGGTSSPSSPAPASGGTTSLSDVGASFAGWAENTMGSMAQSIMPQTASASASGGFIDLSGVDRVTGDIFTALASSSGGGGGGGGCACAGCACACACAGGGR